VKSFENPPLPPPPNDGERKVWRLVLGRNRETATSQKRKWVEKK
jgi:hypothetical protein